MQYTIRNDLRRNKTLYFMIIPVILFYILFSYVPMYGILIAFKNYTPSKGILGSAWVGFRNFQDFFSSYYFWRILGNTLKISVSSPVFGFPAPIILALLMNEIKNRQFLKIAQTASYLPHFISLVIVCGLIKDFTADRGIINDIIAFFGGERVTMLTKSSMFVPIYVISGIWQNIGWESIVYLAALSGIDTQLYEACKIDGAGKFRQIVNVAIPCILPTIIIMLILKIGNLLTVGHEKIILLYNPSIYETADVISSFVYRKVLQEASWSYSTAVGLFNSLINCILLITANFLSRKFNETSLW